MNTMTRATRERFDELVETNAALEDWKEFAAHMENVVRELQARLMSIKFGLEHGEGRAAIDVTADFRALDAIRREVGAMIESLRSRSTRELPIRKGPHDSG